MTHRPASRPVPESGQKAPTPPSSRSAPIIEVNPIDLTGDETTSGQTRFASDPMPLIPLNPEAPLTFASHSNDEDEGDDDAGDNAGDGLDDVAQPDEQDNWYNDLGEASCLDTSPE